MRTLPFLLPFACLGCAGNAAPDHPLTPEIIVSAARHGEECFITVGERQFLTSKLENADLVAHLGTLKGHTFLLRFDGDTPYRCIGTAVFLLQRAEARFRAPQIPSE